MNINNTISMKAECNPFCGTGAAARVLLVLSLAVFALPIEAAQFSEARVTKAVNDVTLLPANRSAMPAKLGSVVSGTTAVQTGNRSRAELAFPDETVARLGSNSIFSFDAGGRDVELQQGSLLIQAPKGLGRTNIASPHITAAITGTTILFEYSPPARDAIRRENKVGVIKIIVVEGSLEWAFKANPRKKLKMRAGDMVAFPSNARTLPRKVKVDLKRVRNTSQLMDGGLGQLPDMVLVNREIAGQEREVKDGNHPTQGFPLKEPKPDDKPSEASEAAESRTIMRVIQQLVSPRAEPVDEPVRDSNPSVPAVPAVPEVIEIPTRPDRCPQDSLDALCRRPGSTPGTSP